MRVAQWCAISGACRGKRGYWLSFALTCSGDGFALLFLFDRSIDDIHALLVGQFSGAIVLSLRDAVVLALICDVRAVATVHHFQFSILAEGLDVALLLLCTALLYEVYCLLQSNLHRVGVFRNRHIFLLMKDVRTESSGADDNVSALEFAEVARQAEELQSLFESDSLKTKFLRQLGKARLFLIVSGASAGSIRSGEVGSLCNNTNAVMPILLSH